MSEHQADAEEIREVMSVISTEIPKLLEAISKSLSNPEDAQKMGVAVANFYKQMKAAGMDDRQAFELTQKFMSSFSVGGMISQVLGSAKSRGEIDELVQERIREKVKKGLDDED